MVPVLVLLHFPIFLQHKKKQLKLIVSSKTKVSELLIV